MTERKGGYKGNINLSTAHEEHEWTVDEIKELARCEKDPVYFAEKYFKIIHVDKGVIPLKLYDFQKEAIRLYATGKKKLCANTSRQIGKTTVATAIILHFVIFNKAKKVALLSNKESSAIEIMSRIKMAYELLPRWLQCGVVEWSKKNVKFDNGSEIQAAATSSSNIRGTSKSMVYIDECVSEDTLISIRNKKTGEIQKITIGEAYQLLNPEASSIVIFSDEFEILTENGWKDFHGFKRTKTESIIRFLFSDGSELKCTENHLLKLLEGFKEADNVSVGDITSTNLIVENIEKYESGEWVYDALEVDGGHEYITNNVTSHNCAFVENWEEFSASVLPVLSSGKESRLILTSTPKGFNHFYYYCQGAMAKGTERWNGFEYIETKWFEIPGRDNNWKQTVLAEINYDQTKFEQEYECSFQGSSGALISGAALRQMQGLEPIYNTAEGFSQYFKVDPEHTYILVADPSEGKGIDSATFSIFDVSIEPYRQVATYKNNMTTPADFAVQIVTSAKTYNNAFVLVENNNMGSQVLTLLWDIHEYENIMRTENQGRGGKQIVFGADKRTEMGIRTTNPLKLLGCSLMKLLIEQQKIIIHDKATIDELGSFVKKGASYAADTGKHDDTVTPLWLFAWLTQTKFWANVTERLLLSKIVDNDKEIYDKQLVELTQHIMAIMDGAKNSNKKPEVIGDEVWFSMGEGETWEYSF